MGFPPSVWSRHTVGEESEILREESASLTHELALVTHTTIGARPIGREVRERGAGREALAGVAARLVVEPLAFGTAPDRSAHHAAAFPKLTRPRPPPTAASTRGFITRNQ